MKITDVFDGQASLNILWWWKIPRFCIFLQYFVFLWYKSLGKALRVPDEQRPILWWHQKRKGPYQPDFSTSTAASHAAWHTSTDWPVLTSFVSLFKQDVNKFQTFDNCGIKAAKELVSRESLLKFKIAVITSVTMTPSLERSLSALCWILSMIMATQKQVIAKQNVKSAKSKARWPSSEWFGWRFWRSISSVAESLKDANFFKSLKSFFFAFKCTGFTKPEPSQMLRSKNCHIGPSPVASYSYVKYTKNNMKWLTFN